ncbi:MAG: helix-turn-helix transcriptional regulator [Chloroflexi bacterium]|nr:helix-turn-helix transcriptional regulator [Chloroflexota bacterium]
MADKKTDETEDTGAARPRLHGDMLTTSVLAFLRTSSAYGYQLTRMLEEAGLPDFDSGSVYRTLRQLERSGKVSSFWDTSESGPARRMYTMTSAGEIFLRGWIDVIDRYQAVLQQTADVFRGEERPNGEPDPAPSARGTGAEAD